MKRKRILILGAAVALAISGCASAVQVRRTNPLRENSSDVTDTIAASDLAATSTTYADFSGVSKSSGAVYAGNSAKDSSGNIQMRSKNSNSGIVSTTSGGTVKSVKITVGSGSNAIDVYGSNTAYTAASDLYATGSNSNQGTKIGSVTETGTIAFNADYEYVGIRSNNGAVYVSSVEITWEAGTQTPSISLNKAELTLEVGKEESLTATLSGGATGTVVWSSDDEDVATVEDGVVTAVAVGTATITATLGNLSASCEVTVEPAINYGTELSPLTIAEAKAVLDKTGASLSKQPLYVRGIVSSNDAYGSSYGNYGKVWLQSDDGSVAQAFELYRVTADSAVTTTYAAQDSMIGCEVVAYGYGCIYNSTTYELTTSTTGEPANPSIVSLTAPQNIVLSKTELAIGVGDEEELSATLPEGATGTVVWSSDDEDVATVEDGVVTAVAVGTATITATLGNLSASCEVTVEPAINYGTELSPLTIAEAKAVLDKTGASLSKQPLYVRGIVSSNDAYGSSYGNYGKVWLQSDDGSVAQAFELYRVTADSAVTTTYAAQDSMIGCEVVAYGYGCIYNSTTYELTTSTTGEPANPSIVSLTAPSATDISLDSNSANVLVGKTITLTATLTPSGASDVVSWKSSNADVATVAAGVVTGIAPGTVTITAFIDTDDDGVIDASELKAECTVSVNRATYSLNSTIFEADLTNTMNVTTGFDITSSSVAKKTGYYQDGGTANESVNYFMVKGSSTLFTSEPVSIKLTVELGAGSDKDPLDHSVEACFVDSEGEEIDDTTVTVATALTKDSAIYVVNLTYSSNAYGVKLMHVKESGWNARYYSFKLSCNYASSFVELSGTETFEDEQFVSVDSVAMRLGARISVQSWTDINSNFGTIKDYGVMLFKRLANTTEPTLTVEKAFQEGRTLATVRKGSGDAPYLDTDTNEYVFNAKVNISSSNYGLVIVAAPFVVIEDSNGDDQYYFLDQLEYSAKTLAEYYLANGGSDLSDDALTVIAA